MSMCRECWGPTPKGRELCDWCAMTPAQRRAAMRWRVLLLAAFVAAVLTVAKLAPQ